MTRALKAGQWVPERLSEDGLTPASVQRAVRGDAARGELCGLSVRPPQRERRLPGCPITGGGKGGGQSSGNWTPTGSQ